MFSKIAHIVRDHPMGTGNALATTTLTSTTANYAGFITENFQVLHLGLSILVGTAAIISYGIGAYIKIKDYQRRERPSD